MEKRLKKTQIDQRCWNFLRHIFVMDIIMLPTLWANLLTHANIEFLNKKTCCVRYYLFMWRNTFISDVVTQVVLNESTESQITVASLFFSPPFFFLSFFQIHVQYLIFPRRGNVHTCVGKSKHCGIQVQLDKYTC